MIAGLLIAIGDLTGGVGDPLVCGMLLKEFLNALCRIGFVLEGQIRNHHPHLRPQGMFGLGRSSTTL